MKTPILGSSYVARSVNAADNRMVNLFPEIVPEAGKEPAFLQRAPGLRKLATVGTGPIRGLWQFGGFGYVASGNYLYRINSNWESEQIGELVGSSQVSMSDNGTQLFVACNPNGYIFDTGTETFSTLTVNFPGAVTVGFLDGFFVFNQPNSQKLWVTDLYDGTTVDSLNFASAEGSPDNVVSIIVDHRELWVFGTNSTEVWYNAGTAGFPFAPIQGAFNEIGCAAPYSVAKLDNTLFWLGADARGRGIVYRAVGYKGQRVSTHAVEWQIQQYSNMNDAIGYTYQQDGHIFYVLIFPTANTTWVYDAATESWHERAGWENFQFVRHRSNCQMSFNEEIVVGDYQNGNIYAFDLNKYDDHDATQKWLRSWRALPTGQNNLKRTAQHSLQLDCETGVGLQGVDFYDPLNELATESGAFLTTESGEDLLVQTTYTIGANPKVMLRWSDDGGHTWSNEHWTSIGRIGRYGYRAFWRRLGMTQKIRDRVYEISATDPVKIAIMGAELILSETNA
jgi:hypothetical protein